MSYTLETRKIYGKFDEVFYEYEDVFGKTKTRPKNGLVFIRPACKTIKVKDNDSWVGVDLYGAQNHIVEQVTNGYFEAELIVTDQPNINPQNWTYEIIPSWRNNLVINIEVPESLKNGTEIDLNQYISDPEKPGTVIEQGQDGRGIENIGKDPSDQGYVLVEYTDGSTDRFRFPIIDSSGQGVKLYHEHIQTEPESVWIVEHKLNRPISSVRTYFGSESSSEYMDDLVLCAWHELDRNTLEIYVTDSEQPGAQTKASGRAIIS